MHNFNSTLHWTFILEKTVGVTKGNLFFELQALVILFLLSLVLCVFHQLRVLKGCSCVAWYARMYQLVYDEAPLIVHKGNASEQLYGSTLCTKVHMRLKDVQIDRTVGCDANVSTEGRK